MPGTSRATNFSEDISEAKNLAESNPVDLQKLTDLMQSAYQDLITDSVVWTPRSTRE